MKFLAVAALLAPTLAVSHYQLIQKDKSTAMQQKLSLMTTDEISNLMQQTLSDQPAAEPKKEVAVAKDAELKAVEGALSRRVLDRLLTGGYYSPYYTNPLPADLASTIAAINAYHTMILNYETQNAIAGLVAPSVEEALKVMHHINDPVDSSSKKKEEKPAASSFVQVKEKGVPVYVRPTLLSNDAADEDLEQRDYVIDGINGIGFLQTKEEGVPVYVNPESILREDTVGRVPFGTKMKVGIDEVSYAQLDNPVKNPPFNNWSVNQPSPPHAKGMGGKEDLGLRDVIIDGVNYDLVQLNNPVKNPPFNNWSVNQPSPPHAHGMGGKEDLGLRDVIIDGVNYDLVQLDNPVKNPPFNNWSVNQPSPPHAKGMGGKEDLGLREIIIDGVNYDI